MPDNTINYSNIPADSLMRKIVLCEPSLPYFVYDTIFRDDFIYYNLGKNAQDGSDAIGKIKNTQIENIYTPENQKLFFQTMRSFYSFPFHIAPSGKYTVGVYVINSPIENNSRTIGFIFPLTSRGTITIAITVPNDILNYFRGDNKVAEVIKRLWYFNFIDQKHFITNGDSYNPIHTESNNNYKLFRNYFILNEDYDGKLTSYTANIDINKLEKAIKNKIKQGCKVHFNPKDNTFKINVNGSTYDIMCNPFLMGDKILQIQINGHPLELELDTIKSTTNNNNNNNNNTVSIPIKKIAGTTFNTLDDIAKILGNTTGSLYSTYKTLVTGEWEKALSPTGNRKNDEYVKSFTDDESNKNNKQQNNSNDDYLNTLINHISRLANAFASGKKPKDESEYIYLYIGNNEVDKFQKFNNYPFSLENIDQINSNKFTHTSYYISLNNIHEVVEEGFIERNSNLLRKGWDYLTKYPKEVIIGGASTLGLLSTNLYQKAVTSLCNIYPNAAPFIEAILRNPKTSLSLGSILIANGYPQIAQTFNRLIFKFSRGRNAKIPSLMEKNDVNQ